jgi:hypothetical protein
MPYKDKEKQKRYLKQYHKIHRKIYHEKLGTTDFEPMMNRKSDGEPDWKKELQDIMDEFKLLRLKRKL